tara:strand:- start:193 stop:1011 length:819 start_codon:yes stop_codon:yes gene_type:complete
MGRKHGSRATRGPRHDSTRSGIFKKARRKRSPGTLSSEIKIVKRNFDAALQLSSETQSSHWFTPWNRANGIVTYVDPEVWATPQPPTEYRELTPAIGEFIPVGAAYNERIGRRVRMLNTDAQMVFNFVPKSYPPTDPTQPKLYSYVNSAEVRVVHGWVKRGASSLDDLNRDQTFWKDYEGPDYEILGDRVYARQLLASGFPNAADGGSGVMIGTYKSINCKFNWKSNRFIDFSSFHSDYDGWVPFVQFTSKHVDKVDMIVEYLRSSFRYQDA